MVMLGKKEAKNMWRQTLFSLRNGKFVGSMMNRLPSLSENI
jgi:hypothetical protein